uniref:Uncharacterized protein n=1 Tax=Vitis vinifera TaxID=29760 RepID=A5BI92_VITVI|nr:hypothetical protein VITISV_003307 [Vitis vinifera]
MNQLIHQVGTNQMVPLPGIVPESNGAVAGNKSNGAVAGDGATLHCACHIEYKIAEEAMNSMSYVAEVSRRWDEPNARDMGRMTSQPNAKGEMYILNDGIDMKAKIPNARHSEKVGRWADRIPDVRHPEKVGRRRTKFRIIPDVRHPKKVGRRPDRVPDVRHPEKVGCQPDKIAAMKHLGGMSENFCPGGMSDATCRKGSSACPREREPRDTF